MTDHLPEPRRLYQEIADQLRILISDESFAPNGRLPAERDLARQFGVSRASVREALIALEIAGRVEIRMGSGVYVTRAPGERAACAPAAAEDGEPIGESPLDILRARALVEGALVASVAPQIRAKQLHAVRASFQQMNDAVARQSTGAGRPALPRAHCRGIAQPRPRPAGRIASRRAPQPPLDGDAGTLRRREQLERGARRASLHTRRA
jgi:DNA-binding FadR family transcriptional regulator